MSAEDAQSYTDNVRQWWDRNPFTMGLGSKEENDLTGRVEQVDAKFFQETDRKLRKWWVGATHEEGQRVLAKFVPYALLRGKKVLDIAIGTGWSVVDFAAEGAQVTGIDLTDEAVRLTQRHLALKGLTADVQRMDAQQLAFADGSFDFVLAWGCLMHMPDTERALKQIARVLVPGGGTVAYWYNKSSWTYWFNFIFLRGILCGKLLTYRFNTTRLVSRYTDGSSQGGNMLTKVYSPKDLERMYRAAGFSKVEVVTMPLRNEADGWPAAKFPVFKYLPKSVRQWMARKWAWGLVVTATK
jgi:2-polyprenyl-3-methyl-5-hydroxy-6-metoxy-1,4-benzoquinol methylase